MDKAERLPELPDGYFFRIREGHFFGPTVVVEIRKVWKLGPFTWSTREDIGWSTQKIMETDSDVKVAVMLAQVLARRLAERTRPVDLQGLEGDHRRD